MDIKIHSFNPIIDEELLYGTLDTDSYLYEGQLLDGDKPHGVGRTISKSSIYEG